ncbi:hypothetical protein RR46_09186 [Papilio xuthus]|uniref:Uncharacterized protein n=1 Tax=Papilio xuthus TaxID=66420 RepID=A0A194PWZ0_PAPXU|nr:hypothetical protein RR46_09186 [Papilio xuthus]
MMQLVTLAFINHRVTWTIESLDQRCDFILFCDVFIVRGAVMRSAGVGKRSGEEGAALAPRPPQRVATISHANHEKTTLLSSDDEFQ